MVINVKPINGLKAPLQIYEKTIIGVRKLWCSVVIKQTSLDLARSCNATLRKPIRKRNNASAMIHGTSVQNKMADGNNIFRPVSTFSNKFRLFMFDGATSAEACVAEPLK